MADVSEAQIDPKVEAFQILMTDLADALTVKADLDNRFLGAKEMKGAELSYRTKWLLDDDPKLPQWKANVHAVHLDEVGSGYDNDGLSWDDICTEVRNLGHWAAIAGANVELAKLALTGFLGEAIYARAPKLEISLSMRGEAIEEAEES